MTKDKITHASLFSGIGGAELAAQRMGWKNLFHCEINEFGNKVLSYWFPESKAYEDITKQNFSEWRGKVTVLTAGFPCFVAGTPVLTRRGIIPIEQVLPGDEALSADGEWHRVLGTMRHEADMAVRLRAQGMHEPLTCTPNHPFLTRRVIKDSHTQKITGYAPEEYVAASELRKGDKVAYPLRRGRSHFGTPAFWHLVGTWLADGWTREAKRPGNHGFEHKVLICCGKEHLPRLTKTISDAGYAFTISEDRTCYKAIICDRWLCEFLRGFGKRAWGKRLAPVCYDLDDERKRELFEGWMCDGYTDADGVMRVTTVSEELALGMAQVARDVYKRPVSVSRKVVDRECVIEGRTVSERPQYCLTVPSGSKYGFYEDGKVWASVKLNQLVAEDNVVYNLEVEDEHSYTACGLAVHNCQPFSLAGRRKGADDDRYLWPQTIRVIEEVRPSYFVGENVAGLLSMVQPDSEPAVEGGENAWGADVGEGNIRRFTIEQICRDLEGAGYSVRTFVIPACAVGAPHRRDRVWIVAKLAPDPDSLGWRWRAGGPHPEGEQKGEEERKGLRPAAKGDGATGDAADSAGGGLSQEGAEQPPAGAGGDSPEAFPDSDGIGRNSLEVQRRFSEEGKGELQPEFADCPQVWWRDFPSQPPVCRGDDGLPTGMDDLAVPYSRWRAESIKAFGNAWVPQVAQEIFMAIEKDIMEEESREQ